MVKILLPFLLIFNIFANEIVEQNTESNLTIKIKSFLDKQNYLDNQKYIKIIFSPEENFYINDRIDVVKVVNTLKENGLLKLFFKRPKEFKLSFVTSGTPLFFVKIMKESLRDIGYYRYVTVSSKLNNSEFRWDIVLTSEYATDPTILQKELAKKGCKIVDIQRDSATNWIYTIDMNNAFLNLIKLQNGLEIELKRSLYAHWLNISAISKLKVVSSFRNSWYPYIAFYDNSMHLLKVIRRDAKTRYIKLKIPKNATYMKLSDMYSLKNIKDTLTLIPYEVR